MSAGAGDPDDGLEAELRELFMSQDPIPPDVGAAARAAIGWRRIDAELAALMADSVLDEGLALARGSDQAPRSLSCAAGSLTIDLEIHDGPDHPVGLGQVSPPGRTGIQLQTAGQDALGTTESDELGRFRIALPETGLVRLRLAPQGPGTRTAAWVETSWIPL
jgi:hypothetical protein